MQARKKIMYEFEEFIARNLTEWPSVFHENIQVTEECKEVDLYDWGNGNKQMRSHYYVPSYGVGNSITKERWIELRKELGIDGKPINASKLSDRVVGVVPDWVLEEIKILEGEEENAAS